MKTQKIKRKDLKVIYGKVCQNWQKTIAEITMFEEGAEIEVDNDLILKAHSEADVEQKKLIKKYFKIVSDDKFSVTTYKEVCKRLGIKELTIKDFKQFEGDALKMLSFHQIKNLERFFNGNWVADWKNQNQYKYYPYFTLSSSGGLVFTDSCCVSFRFYGDVGYYLDSKTSDHIGKNFIDIYNNLK